MSAERDFYETHDCKEMQVFKDLEAENEDLLAALEEIAEAVFMTWAEAREVARAVLGMAD